MIQEREGLSLFDLHCHLDLFNNPKMAFDECQNAKIFTLSVTTTPRAWKQNLAWANGNPYVLPALGLHPEIIGAHAKDKNLLLELIKECSVIGEVGLDGSGPHRKTYATQLSIFEEIVSEVAKYNGKVLSIHSRFAVKDVVKTLSPYKSNVHAILHWFSGSSSELKAAIQIGAYFSLNGSMFHTERNLDLIDSIPLDKLLIESDAPFRNKISTIDQRLADLISTIEKLAKLKGYETKEMWEIINNNSRIVLSIN